MLKKIDATLILPCYNEAEHFEKSVARILRVLRKTNYDWEVIFIDDKSSDETAKKIREFLKLNKFQEQTKNPPANVSFRAFFHQKNQGRGATVSHGIKEAKGGIVGYIDIDGEIDPHYIPIFVDKINEGFEVVCAWRIYQFHLFNLPRYVASKAYLLLQKRLLKSDFPDTEAGYKFFRKEKIKPVLLQVKAKHWFWDTEVMTRAKLSGLKIAYIPTVFIRRRDKKSTVRLIPDALDYLKNLWRLRNELDKGSQF